jgi:PPOX class probable F420-dependent enzyme
MLMPGFIPWSKVDLPLRATRSIWVATIRPDGRAHAVPVWYVWDGTGLSFITRRDMQKAKNLAHQPWAVAHLEDGDDVVILEGTVEIISDPDEVARIDALYGEKYVAPRTGAHDTVFHENTDLYRLHVRHVMAWEYGNTSTRTDWRFDP